MEDFLTYVVTWNVATKFPQPKTDLKALLGLKAENHQSKYFKVPDLYIIGFQEVKAQPQNILWDAIFEDPWIVKVKETLAPFGLVQIKTLRMQGLVTTLLLKRQHLTFLRDVEGLWTRRGLGGIWGNKGAISIRINIHGCSFCFVNCHLAPHDHLLKERIEDYQNILSTQEFSYPETANILYHDYVFWFGDLNFRLSGSKAANEIAEIVSSNKWKDLITDDQLTQVMRRGEAFSELKEMEITFPPTFKFDEELDSYDVKRRPAWTDRILHQVNTNAYDNVKLKAVGQSYQSHVYRISDHRPVSAIYTCSVFKPTIEKIVHFAEIPVWYVGEVNSIRFTVCPTYEIASEDWIALYKADFTSLDDYVSYVYAPHGHPQRSASYRDLVQALDELVGVNTPLPIDHTVHFAENSVNFEGSYVLIYMSHSSRSVYAVSNSFEVVCGSPVHST